MRPFQWPCQSNLDDNSAGVHVSLSIADTPLKVAGTSKAYFSSSFFRSVLLVVVACGKPATAQTGWCTGQRRVTVSDTVNSRTGTNFTSCKDHQRGVFLQLTGLSATANGQGRHSALCHCLSSIHSGGSQKGVTRE
ncbi:hypothetical protein E4U43_007458 [Claviceps pusilla]|uniref:Uncharacterized protein n=1 Tax=Claviceps pusilla TaxID=123648 RepID=A0A9P7NDI4_9HYPO|nr:hypothetical protein E4U43_007458 [Claviceps pusilla]